MNKVLKAQGIRLININRMIVIRYSHDKNIRKAKVREAGKFWKESYANDTCDSDCIVYIGFNKSVD